MIETTALRARVRASVSRTRLRPIAIAAALGILIAGSVATSAPTVASAAKTPSFPSWGAVVAAKRSVTAKKHEIARLTSLIRSLDAKVEATQAVAKEKGDA